jgi:hypothetical protein
VVSGELDASSATLVADAAIVVPTGSARVDSPVLELFVLALELTASVLELAEASIVAPARTLVVEVKVLVSVLRTIRRILKPTVVV